MRKIVALCLGLVCMAYIAACGGSSSTATTTVYDTLPTPAVGLAPPTQALLGGAIQGKALVFAAPLVVTPFAGGGAGFSNISSAGGATFNRPIAVTADKTNLYVADYMNNAIRQINIATQHVTTIAGNTAGLAGSADGIGTAAFFNRPNGITIDGNNNLYVTDSGNFTIRKIDLSTKAVTTLAGAAGSAGSVDSTTIGTNARFNLLNGITTDGISLFVTDSNNTVRRIALPPSGTVASGPVTTVAGTPGTTGSTDGVQAAARFNLPARITTDGPNLYVTDFNNSTIRKIALDTGKVTTIAGKVGPGGTAGSHLDSTDNGLNARFNQPNGITCDGKNLYVTDSYDNTVRKVVLSSTSVASGAVTTLTTIVTAPLNSVLPNSTVGITTNGTSLYVTDFTVDTLSHTIQKILGL